MSAAATPSARFVPLQSLGTIGEYFAGRDNNFALVRLLAALAVLVTHSFAVVTGSGQAEPLRGRLDMTLGEIAVDVFFTTSGFLVCASLLRRGSAIDYLRSRALRVLPALVVMQCLLVYVAGPFLSALPAREYLAASGTHAYFLRGVTLLGGVGWTLPGVFEHNAFRSIVNASLWTLPWEVWLYIALLATAGLVRTRGWSGMVRDRVVIALVAAGAAAMFVARWQGSGFDREIRLVYMFAAGAALYVLRDRVTFRPVVIYAAFALMASCLAFGQREAFFVAYALAAPYLLLYVALVPAGAMRKFNRVPGDYSYGIYIYAFPVQQALQGWMRDSSVAGLMLAATLVTGAFAIASWHLVEAPALRLKKGAP